MRGLLILAGIAALSLAGCSDTKDENAGELAGAPQPAAVAAGSVELRGDGLAVTGPLGTSLTFNSPREVVESELAKVLGAIAERNENSECGGGPVQSSQFNGGLTVNFQDGRLVGWFYDGGKANGLANSMVATDKGVGIGSPATAFVGEHGGEPIEGSTLAAEFTSDGGIGAFMEGEADAAKVESLHAGTNCFFR